ncbi:MAG: HAD family hydrolase [Synergistaceae bacterium]|nr:HAD family hydrolase [Synergistaceae bacterium]
MREGKKWIILDRDGTIIAEKGYLHDPDEVEILPGVIEGLTKLKEAGYKLIVLTNQSGIGRGYYSENDMEAVHSRISALLSEQGIEIAGYYHCPHTPDDGCGCRKPKTGLAGEAANELGFDLVEIACVIGDKRCDVELARNLGVPSILVKTGYGAEEYAEGVCALHTVQNLNEAAEIVLNVDGG